MGRSNKPEDSPLVSAEAESYVIGCLMVDGTKMNEAQARLTPTDFADKGLALIFGVLLGLHSAHVPYSLPAAAEALKARGALDAIGGTKRLMELCEAGWLPSHFTHYARIVADLSRLRDLKLLCGCLSMEAHEIRAADHAQVCDFMVDAQARVRKLVDSATASMTTMTATDLLERAAVAARSPIPVKPVPKFNLLDLDKLGDLLKPGLVIVGARPGVGKSTLLLHAAVEAARQGVPSMMVSLEMPEAEIAERVVARETGQPRPKGGYAHEVYDYTKTDQTLSPLRIRALPRVSIDALRVLAKDAQRRGELQMLMVDYLQLVSARRAENRQQEVAAVARGLKDISLELDIPVVAAAQLNRASMHREEPGLDNLRESGDIESAADVVILLWEEEDGSGPLKAKVAKHRGGAKGTATLDYQRATYRLRDAAIFGTPLESIRYGS